MISPFRTPVRLQIERGQKEVLSKSGEIREWYKDGS